MRYDPMLISISAGTGKNSSLREVALLTNAVIKFVLFSISLHVAMSVLASSALMTLEASKL